MPGNLDLASPPCPSCASGYDETRRWGGRRRGDARQRRRLRKAVGVQHERAGHRTQLDVTAARGRAGEATSADLRRSRPRIEQDGQVEFGLLPCIGLLRKRLPRIHHIACPEPRREALSKVPQE